MNCDNQCCENHHHHHHKYNGGEYGINVNTLVHTNELLLVEQAAELVPVDKRKPGTKITFWTYSGWETWQFISKDVREWPLREAWKQQSVYGMDNIKDLQNQIDSMQIGGWAISQEFGDDEHIGISQKKLTEEFNNVARLDDDGKVPPHQLPSYVDDVLDGYFYNNVFYADENHTQLLEAETGKIYVDIPSKVSYRYSGSAYVAISNPYYPDEEDLTVVNDIVKFKDKAYDATAYSGLGRKILRKNMVDGVNLLTQAMVNTQNTIYVIQYDFVVSESITVPANCVLKFEGGSLDNGTIVGQNTVISSDLTKIFGTDITISGTWNIEVAYPEWFGAKGDGTTMDTVAIQKTFDSFTKVKFVKGTYKSDALSITKVNHIIGVGQTRGHGCRILFDFSTSNKTALGIVKNESMPYLKFENIQFAMNSSASTYVEGTICIKKDPEISLGSPIRMYNCGIMRFETALYNNGSTYYDAFVDCYFIYIGTCLSYFNGNNLRVERTYVAYVNYFIHTIEGDGPATIKNSSFEHINNNIVYAPWAYNGDLVFEGNYVENYTNSSLFSGALKSVISTNNLFQIGGLVTSVYYLYSPRYLRSEGNVVDVQGSTTELRGYFRYYKANDDKLQSILINDSAIIRDGADISNYGIPYFNEICNANTKINYVDPVTNKTYSLNNATAVVPTQGNGYWYTSIANRAAIGVLRDHSIHLSGYLDKVNGETVVAGQENIASFNIGSVANMNISTYERYFFVHDTSYNQVTLKINLSTGVIDFVSGDTTKGLLFDNAVITLV